MRNVKQDNAASEERGTSPAQGPLPSFIHHSILSQATGKGSVRSETLAASPKSNTEGQVSQDTRKGALSCQTLVAITMCHVSRDTLEGVCKQRDFSRSSHVKPNC
ncbi:hypothetical protein Pmani_037103 [Petrolisthes manimaculis]|uniref:Uncharacterized protein n=1 Tax=Petrolisthes manimaculis TaxID=1843537 RepID=A0AAE1NJU7_9EUCA|nr:hypothetical protein Pmani_037103 [Petrolisthes manimaculis]